MSGFTAAPPSNGGYQSVMTPGFGGYGMGMGTGMGIESLLILLLLGGNNGNRGGLFGNNGNGCSPAATTVATDVVLAPAFQNLQSQISNLQQNISSDAVAGKISDLSGQICASGQNINNTNNANTRELSNGIGDLNTNIANANLTTLQSIRALQSDLTAQGTQQLIQNINQSQNTNGLITTGFNNQVLTSLTGFSQIEKSIDGVSREMAECCCAIKSTVRDSIDVNNNNTQKILDSMANGRYSDLLEKYNAVQAVNSNLIQTNILKDNNAAQTATILHHLAPFLCGTQNGNGNSSIVR